MSFPPKLLPRVLLPLLLACSMWAARAADDFLEPERAFVLSARALGERQVELAFDVVPGYYLYRDKFKFEAPDAVLGEAIVPAGKTKFDETFQKNVETHRGLVRIVLPVDKAPREFRLVVTSQGCAGQSGRIRWQRQRTGGAGVHQRRPQRDCVSRRRCFPMGRGRCPRRCGAAEWSLLARGRRVLHRGAVAVVHTLRVADGADPIVVDCRPWRRCVACPWPVAGCQLLAGNGARLHRVRCWNGNRNMPWLA